MRSKYQLLLMLAGLCANVASEAGNPTTTSEFRIWDVATGKQTPTLQARLGQYVCLHVRARLVTDREYSVRTTVYDGLGREIDRLVSRAIVTNAWLDTGLCRSFDEEKDAPGTWWYVVELDDEPLVSTSIEIRE